ncbi:hypothetical protein [Parapedobacter tibetensis]|uniref:hypothetical protein n=1 Tax=Parapedobacter tibetensis TaxID=2972951 RepID=UPI00214D4F2D|nr:hypothetical protein [Parapedobacter tibetensis]
METIEFRNAPSSSRMAMVPGLTKLQKETMGWLKWLRALVSPAMVKAAFMLGLCMAFVFSGWWLRWLDPTAAVVDVGALSLLLLAGLSLLAFLTVSHWLLGLLWPVLRDYQRHYFTNNFKSLQSWQKITFYLGIFFGLLYAFVCCLVAVF